ncbi:protein phosphatase 1 regulatory inhibitor subunit 16B isoform X2 [Lingula anatina]|uniref:Protein phosphatase 1 regulatory inhibitor subunit 16B isoform X2 n=1 Tax=Lingula anatina TaxID=7574 RepID=A0A1S3I5F6_LINAN|nr:protein phosphatase 1 regulatory inhibitor subunit 16B isoform X2 [Lingula anatina]|eukprot:XP_013393458.1 protein phosphatase 1 regulatory inhibitor subunit 16B isoform X2 [Lingula anatina]
MADHSELVAEIPFVEKMSMQDRLKHARKRRAYQLKKYFQYDKHFDKEQTKQRRKSSSTSKKSNHNNNTKKRKGNGSIFFEGHVMLLEAAARNDIDEVRRLLTAGVSPDVTNEDGLTALHQCCIDDYEEMARLLIDFGANVNARDSELWTPLHAAATCAHIHLCALLILKGAEVLAVNADGNMPYDICEDDITLDYIENEMAKKGITQEMIDDTRMDTEKMMLRDIKQLAEEKKDLEFVDENGATPLHIAAANGYESVVEFLLDHHVSVDVRDVDGWTPIHGAACWGQPAILEILVQNGADIESKSNNGETPYDICEDPEFKQRILELKDEMENNKLSRTKEIMKRRGHNTRRSVDRRNNFLSIPMSASVRRSSMREKSMISWKEAKEEGRFLEALAHTHDQNGSGDAAETTDAIPVSNIDDVTIAVSGHDTNDSTTSSTAVHPDSGDHGSHSMQKHSKKETVINGDSLLNGDSSEFSKQEDSGEAGSKKHTEHVTEHEHRSHKEKDIENKGIKAKGADHHHQHLSHSHQDRHKHKEKSDEPEKKLEVKAHNKEKAYDEVDRSPRAGHRSKSTGQRLPQETPIAKVQEVARNSPKASPVISSRSGDGTSVQPKTGGQPANQTPAIPSPANQRRSKAPAAEPSRLSVSSAGSSAQPLSQTGTLSDLKKKRAESHQQRISSYNPETGEMHLGVTNANSNKYELPENGHNSNSGNSKEPSLDYYYPPGEQMKRFRAQGPHEIIGGDDNKEGCCVIL